MVSNTFLDAVEQGDFNQVTQLLESGADANACDEHQRSAAYKAAKKGHLAILKLLAAEGADLNIIDNRGTNALYWAAINGHLDVASFLIENGCKADVVDDRGWTIMDHVDSSGNKKMHALLEKHQHVQGV
ncbi:MAG: ankyrin repeat domain-containing protein [Balneolales bacterium]|nr:ankyrin repeat domain-containing protein [Balneolales bacterium]